MATRSVKISLDDNLLAEVDRHSETREVGRSVVVRRALRLYLALETEGEDGESAPDSSVDLGGLLGG